MKRLSRVIALAALALASCNRELSKPASNDDSVRAYVSDERGNVVVMVDANGRQVGTIAVGQRPRGIKLSADGATLYVAVSGSPIAGPGVDDDELPPADHTKDGIVVVDVASGKIVRSLQAGTDPETFSVSPDGRTLFVSNEDSGELSAIDTAGNRATRRVKVGDEPEGTAVTGDGAHVFVACEGSDLVAMLDARTLQKIKAIDIEGRPRSAITSADGTTIFVAVEGAGKLAILSGRDGSIIKMIDIASGDTGQKPMGIVEAPGGHLYVTTGRGGQLVEVDPQAGSIVRRLRIGGRPWGAAMLQGAKTIVTADGPDGNISIIDLATGTVRASKVGISPWGVAAR